MLSQHVKYSVDSVPHTAVNCTRCAYSQLEDRTSGLFHLPPNAHPVMILNTTRAFSQG